MILKKIMICIFYIVSYALILFGYHLYIVPIYGYSGFEWYPDQIKIVEGLLLSITLSLLLPVSFNRPSDILLHLQLLFPVLPMFVLYGAADWPREFIYYTVASYLLIILIGSSLSVKPIHIINLSQSIFQRSLLAVSFCVIFAIIFFGGIKYLNFNFSNVYEMRGEAARNLPKIFVYFSSLTTKVILPFSILLSFVNKDLIVFIASIAGSVLMFGLTAHKGTVFYPFAVIILYLIAKNTKAISIILTGYILIICASLVSFAIEEQWVGSLMLRRVYLIPAQLNFIYHDYFTNNPFLYWAQSKLSFGMIEYNETIDPSHLIGLQYFDSSSSGANTGWIGSGYMNAGCIGMLLYSIIIGLIIAIINSYSRHISRSILVAITFVPIQAMMTSSDLPTSLFNHGVFLLLILLMMFTADNIRRNYPSV